MTSSPVPPASSDGGSGTRRDRRPVQRDVSTLPAAVAVVGALLVAYLGLAVACATAASPPTTPSPPGDDCYDRVVHHAARLTDC